MNTAQRVWLLRGFTVFTLVLTLGALQQFAQQAVEELDLLTRTRTLALYGGYGMAGCLGLVLLITWTPRKESLLRWLDQNQAIYCLPDLELDALFVCHQFSSSSLLQLRAG